MKRCTTCCLPNTRPDTPFIDGVCSACRSYAKRPEIDWGARKQALLDLLERHHGHCIVPSSGGKDSHYQVLTLLELGAKVQVVTATTCHLTPIGRVNINNLAKFAPTIEVTPDRTQRAKLNRRGLEMVGDISWPEHVAIFTTPFRMAKALNIPLLFYGENPQNQYGGPPESTEALQMTRRWVSEFGGFLGLRVDDIEAMGYDMSAYRAPIDHNAEAHFLGQYLPWDSEQNAVMAMQHGMRWPDVLPSLANWWGHENLDNAQTGLHDYGMWLKYGLSRAAQQLSVDVRRGKIDRPYAMQRLKERESTFPEAYAGVPVSAVLERLGMTRQELWANLDRFTNRALFRRVIDSATAPPMVIDGAYT